MPKIAELEWNGKPLDAFIVIPLLGTAAEWSNHSGQVQAELVDENGLAIVDIAWIWDEDLQSVVAAVFDRTRWDEASAGAWVANERTAAAAMSHTIAKFSSGKKNASIERMLLYWRRLVDNLTLTRHIMRLRDGYLLPLTKR